MDLVQDEASISTNKTKQNNLEFKDIKEIFLPVISALILIFIYTMQI